MYLLDNMYCDHTTSFSECLFNHNRTWLVMKCVCVCVCVCERYLRLIISCKTFPKSFNMHHLKHLHNNFLTDTVTVSNPYHYKIAVVSIYLGWVLFVF